MKNFRTAIVLAAVLGIFSAVAYWDEWQTKKDESTEQGKNKLVELPADVNSISYASTDDETKTTTQVKLEKKADKWQIVEPISAAADQATVENLIKTVADYRYVKAVAKSQSEWGSFGLEAPSRTIQFAGDDKKDATIHIGMKSPVGFNVYVRADKAEEVYLGSQSILMGTAKTLRDFRDKHFIKVDREHLAVVMYELKGEAPVKIIKEKGDYKITEPAAYQADQDSILNMLSDLDGATVEEFVDQPKADLIAKFGKGQFFAKIALQYEDGNQQQLSFTSAKDGFYAAFDPQKVVFKITNEYKNKFSKKLMDFRHRRIFTFDAADALSVEVDGTVYQKVKGDWQLANEKEKPTVKSFIQNLVTDIQYAKTENFLTTKEVAKNIEGAPAHRIKLSFVDANKAPPIVIDTWQSRDNIDKYYVRVDNGTSIFHVDKKVFMNTAEPKPDEAKANIEDLEGLSN